MADTIDVNALIEKVRSMLHKPYVYGAESPEKGFDCSGLIYWACQELGFSIERNADNQRLKNCSQITQEELKPGDLIFRFPRNKDGTLGTVAEHVLIVSGPDTLIHAKGKNYGVVEESLSNFINYSGSRLKYGRLSIVSGTYTGGWGTAGGSTTTTTTSGMLKIQINSTTSWKTNPETDFLLSPTDTERRYGMNIYDGEQPLIKFSTYSGILDAGSAVEALKKYAEFLFYLLNAEISTAQVTCLSMPWIRPGFNVWYDPIYSDTIYYCSGVAHQGDPVGGATTELNLILGRDRKTFIGDSGAFGSMKNRSDNVLMNSYTEGSRAVDFGECVQTEEGFEYIKNAFQKYYGSPSFETVDAEDSYLHKNIYVEADDNSPKPENVDSDKIFSKSYTKDEIEAQLSGLYSKAPSVVKSRGEKLRSAVGQADKFIEKYHLQGG